ncbi:hypothetical protein SAMN03159390_00657 [Pseudomonas sp. NFACC49-2]|uniref:hypothetical protein n=1 Tax=unclassified Pseudomonas TaxID=196821 RepID=UPI00091DB701|nr:hypothetical protein [Pseudomonas sp. NFACC49-2]SFX18192.1 hypothetical protein SAMN03159390_00657 [Pseudomonas sp. NFACC49-2]
MLDNNCQRLENPEAYRSCLLDVSARLAEEGLIDRLDQFDMDEMANAAYWLALEELQSNPVLYRSSYQYDVMPRDGGPRFGTLFHSVLRLDDNGGGPLRAYDGKLYRDKDGLRLNQTYHSLRGRVEGLVLTLHDGRQFDLVEKARMVHGVIYEAIDDPDVYRWMVDVVQVATENHDIEVVNRIRPFLELAKFIECSDCMDRFGVREDCAHCNGLGFVEKLRCPDKLPVECQGQPNKQNDPGEEHVRRS